MMGWLRIRPSPSPTSSLNRQAASLPRPRPKRTSSSFADSFISFDFRRKPYSEGEVDDIGLVSLEPNSPRRVSRSHSPSELPQSEDVVVEHVTPPSSPPRSLHEVLPTPSKTQNAIAFFERKATGGLTTRLPTAADSSSTTTPSRNPSPAYTNAARAERELRKSTSIARPASGASDSEDSMASMVSMLNEPNISTFAEGQQCSTLVHHEADCSPNINMLSPTWLHPPRSVRSSGQKSDSTSSLRTLDTNIKGVDDKPSDLPPIRRSTMNSRFRNSGLSRSWEVPGKDISEPQLESKTGLFHRPFGLSKRSQSRSATEMDNSVAALPCFMTSSDDFMNDRAVQGLQIASPGPDMAGFIDGSNSAGQSFSARSEPRNQSSSDLPLAMGSPASGPLYRPPRPSVAQSPRPRSSRSGLPLSSRSLNKAAATSVLSFFSSPPGMQMSDVAPENLVQVEEVVALPSTLPGTVMLSPSHIEAISFARDVPRTDSPASSASSSRRHSMQRVPVRIDSAAHFPRSVSPSWEVRPKSFSGTIADTLNHSITDPIQSRVPVTVDSAAHFPRSVSPRSWSGFIIDVPPTPLPFDSSFGSRDSSLDEEHPLYSLPIEPSFGRKRSNSKFEPNADLPPISEVRKAETPISEEATYLGADGHKSMGTIHVYDPPICSAHEERPPAKTTEEPRKNEKKGKKLKKKRPHEKTKKIVRYGRRFFLRKKILNLLLGRQLGGAVAQGLKAMTCLPVGTDNLDLAVVAVPGGVSSPLHEGAVFPLAVIIGRNELDSKERNGRLYAESDSHVAMTAPNLGGDEQGIRKTTQHLSMDDLSNAIRHVDYRSGAKRPLKTEKEVID